MAKFPNWSVGLDGSANNFALGIPDVRVKASGASVTNSTVLIDDNEFVSIPLGVGRWWIKFSLFVVSPTAASVLKTQWGFTGTWDNPLRLCKGPHRQHEPHPNKIHGRAELVVFFDRDAGDY